MKKLFITAFLVVILMFGFSQNPRTELHGIVTLNRLGGQPIGYVGVTSLGSGGPTSTDNFGLFILEFEKSPGEIVCISVVKDGLEVVLPNDLTEIALSKDNEKTHKIVMCKTGMRDSILIQLFGISLLGFESKSIEILKVRDIGSENEKKEVEPIIEQNNYEK